MEIEGSPAVVAIILSTVLLVASPPVARAGPGDGAKYETELATLINQYRASKSLPALTTDTMLTTLAREHSADMARERKMNHDGMPSRVRRSGWGMCVENVGWNYATPKAQFDGWRASAGHNQNLLDPRVIRVGIGIVDGYVTQIACGK